MATYNRKYSRVVQQSSIIAESFATEEGTHAPQIDPSTRRRKLYGLVPASVQLTHHTNQKQHAHQHSPGRLVLTERGALAELETNMQPGTNAGCALAAWHAGTAAKARVRARSARLVDGAAHLNFLRGGGGGGVGVDNEGEPMVSLNGTDNDA